MTGQIALAVVAGFFIGSLFASAVLARWTLRPLQLELKDARRHRHDLIAALRPFAPVQVRKVTGRLLGIRNAAGWHYWSCSSWGCASNPGIIGGPPSGEAMLERTNDEAREHYLGEHMTRENIERAGSALREVLGDDWRRHR